MQHVVSKISRNFCSTDSNSRLYTTTAFNCSDLSVLDAFGPAIKLVRVRWRDLHLYDGEMEAEFDFSC